MTQFQVAQPPHLVAVGDGARLRVYRSLGVSVDSPAYQPVRQYIADNGMVLVSTETGPYEGMFGRTEQSHYATPEARMLWLTLTEEDQNV